MNVHSAPLSFRTPRRGFTLIELLTVIAIVGILAAILFPVIGKARTSARRAQGLSNLRQIAMAGLSFSNENKHRWFITDSLRYYKDPETVFWADRLTNYMGEGKGDGSGSYNDVFRDPLITTTSVANGRVIHFSFLLVFTGLPTTDSVTHLVVPNPYSSMAPYNNLSAVNSPSKQVFFADIVAGTDGQSAYSVIQNVGKGSSIYNWAYNPASPADANLTPAAGYGSGAGQIDFGIRDPGHAKVAYLDGHVAVITPDQLKQSNVDPRY